MTDVPLVSVVIPTYNRRRCLAKAIESVQNQDRGPVEIIVVDDASPDGTADWTAAAHPEVRLIRNAVNRGVSASRNAGLAAARGRFIAFLDDDDWWDASFLSRHLDVLEPRPDAVLSYCDFTAVDMDGGAPSPARAQELGDDPLKTFLMGNPIPSLSLVLMSREAAERTRGFREDYDMCEDREFYMRLVSLGSFIHEPRPLVFKTRSADGMTRNLRKWTAATQRLLDDFFTREENARYRPMENQARARWHARLALGCLRRSGTRLLGLRMVAAALRLDAPGAARYAAGRLRHRIART